MNTSETVIQRVVSDIESGRAHWVERHDPIPRMDLAPVTPTVEARRIRDRERKRRQRAEMRGDHD